MTFERDTRMDSPMSHGYTLIPRFSKVVILAPGDAVTGGVEAQHQLAEMITRLGGNAQILYFSRESPFSIKDGKLFGGMLECKASSAYAHYKPIPVIDPDLSRHDMVVFPEIFCRQATLLEHCARSVWWLSVDNALNWNPVLSYPDLNLNLWSDEKIEHYYQSYYARTFLHEKQKKSCRALFDYINLGSKPRGAAYEAKKFDVALFPAKGADLALNFVDRHPNFKYCLIEKMTTAQVAEALRSSSIYIDFGSQPGKDRVPREAAACGSIVFLHRRGAANHFEDCPVADLFKFTSDDLMSGNLSERVALAIANFSAVHSLQSSYRSTISAEELEFQIQVSKIFF